MLFINCVSEPANFPPWRW